MNICDSKLYDYKDVWGNKKIEKIFEVNEKWLFDIKATYCPEVQTIAYLYYNNISFKDIKHELKLFSVIINKGKFKYDKHKKKQFDVPIQEIK